MKILAAVMLAALLTSCASATGPTTGASGTSVVPTASTTVSSTSGPTASPGGAVTQDIAGYKSVGKFFVRFLSLKFSCTAAVIGANVIVTAAHCFKGAISGIKYTTTGWIFAPMWHDNKFPYGKWSVQAVYLAENWITKMDPKFDYAVVVLNPRNGRDVGSYTGQNSWNSSYTLAPGQSSPVRVVGIPEASSKTRVSVTSAVAVHAGARFTVLQASTPGFGNATTGTPWFSPFNTKTDTGTIVGVTGGYQA